MNNEEKGTSAPVSIQFNKNTVKIILMIVVSASLVNWGLNKFDVILDFLRGILSVFSPILIGIVIAFVLNLVLNPIERLWDKGFCRKKKTVLPKKLKRPVSILISIIIVTGIIFALIFMVVPLLKDTIATLIESVPLYAKNLEAWLNNVYLFFADFGIEFPKMDFDTEKLITTVTKLFTQYSHSFFDKTFDITATIFTGVVDFVLAIAFSVYMLSQKEKICRYLKKLIISVLPKKKADTVLNLASITGDTFSNFVTGQVIEACIIGVLCFVGMLIFAMPYSGVISVLIGFTALIPIVGSFIGTVVGAFLILLVTPIKALWFIVFIIVLQQIESNLIYPRVVGKSVGIPGILVLASITVSGGFFGIVGMLFAVPVCSILYTLLNYYIDEKNK